MSFALLDLETLLRKLGRFTLFYAHDGTGPEDIGDPVRWDAASELQLAHLGDTEGPIVFNPQGSVAELHLPEISGDAAHEATYTGDNPMLEAPVFLADPDLLPIVSPTGLASAGHFRVRDVDARTIVAFPEELFRKTDQSYADLSVSGGVFLLDGSPLDSAHDTLLGASIWLWNAYATRPTENFPGGHGDDAKLIQTVAFKGMFHPDLPQGHRLWTRGNPFDYSINIETGS